MKLHCTKDKSRQPVKRDSSEDGYVLGVGVVFFFIIMAVFGLAHDGARLYLTSLRLQRAVDAAAVAGGRLIGTVDADQALEVARATARDSLLFMGYSDQDGIEIEVEWIDPLRPTELRVRANTDLTNLFLGLLPGFPDVSDVSSKSTAIQNRSIVCIVLDTSGSMGVGGKLERLKEAVNSFLDLFEEGVDYIGIVEFSDDGSVVGPLNRNFTQYKGFVNSLISEGGTNTELGLRLCRNEMAQVPEQIWTAANKAVIMVTDGAPTFSCLGNDFTGGPAQCFLDGTGTCDDGTPQEKHYDRAIRLADDIRTMRDSAVSLYTVGLGVTDAEIIANVPTVNSSAELLELKVNDAYLETTECQYILKEHFLRRVANVPPNNGLQEGIEPVNPFIGIDGQPTLNYEQYNALVRIGEDSPPEGVFASTTDAAELTTILEEIGVGIGSRLVE